MYLYQEFCILLLDSDCGSTRTLPGQAGDLGFATAVLLDLSERGRIDLSNGRIAVVDPSPVGDSVVDPVLAELASGDAHDSLECWMRRLAGRAGLADALHRLVEIGVVEQAPGDLFFVAPVVERSRRYPSDTLVAGVEEVRTRLMRTLLLGATPAARDVTLIQLTEACGLLDRILEPSEQAQARRCAARLGRPHPLCELVARLSATAPGAARAPDEASCKPIPDVPGVPLLGNAIGLAGEIRPYLDALYRRHGPICRVRIPGKSIVILSGKEGVEFARRHSQTHLRNDVAFAPMCRASQSDRLLIASGGHDHIKLRRAAHEIASAVSVEANLPAMIAVARDRLSEWRRVRSVSAYAAMQRMSIMQVGHLAFGRSVAPYVDSIRYWNDTLIISMRGDRPYFMVERRLRKVRRHVQRLYREALAQHDPASVSDRPRSMLDHLLEMQRRQPEFISVPDLMSAVINPYFQSSDQIACTLGLALMYLFADPHLADRCRAEADEAFVSGTLDAEGLQGLELIRAVIAEVLRLHAQAPIMQRTARISFEFEGHWVPADTPLWVAAAVVHGDPENYGDPDVFDPDRHLPPRLESQRDGAYTAFGAGAHSCIGEQFASDLMALNLATMLRHAEMDRFPSKDRRVRLTSYPLIRPHAKCRFQISGLRDCGGAPPAGVTASMSQLGS